MIPSSFVPLTRGLPSLSFFGSSDLLGSASTDFALPLSTIFAGSPSLAMVTGDMVVGKARQAEAGYQEKEREAENSKDPVYMVGGEQRW